MILTRCRSLKNWFRSLSQALDRRLEEPNDDLITVLRQGIADEDARRTLTLEQVDARVRATLARRNAEKAPIVPQITAP